MNPTISPSQPSPLLLKKAETVITPEISLQYGTGLPAQDGVFMKNGTKKEWNPSPNILSFSTSFSPSLSLLHTTSAALSWTGRHILLLPDCSDALAHSLCHRVNRVGSALCLDCL